MRAIKAEQILKKFKLIKEVKSEIKKNNVPFLIMTYMNPVYVYSIKKFVKKCKTSNVDGVIIVDSNNKSP